MLRRIGRLAIEAPTPPAQERLAAIAKRLALQAWPRTTLRIAAVDVSTGERHVFDRASGVKLVDAVAASCAVPLVWPPVAIGGRMYMDGGLYSTENADLADDCGRVLVLALRPGTPPLAVVPLGAAIAQLEQRGTTVDVVHPDEGSQAAFSRVGFNLLDPAVMADAAEAGRAQGERLGREPSIRRWSGGS